MENTANSVKKFIGIDVGKLTIKGIILRGNGTVLCEDSVETDGDKGAAAICKNIIKLINRMIYFIGGYKGDIKGVGIGCRGKIDGKSGWVQLTDRRDYYPLAESVADCVDLKVKVTDEGTAAALGKTAYGEGSVYGAAALWM